VEPFSNLVNYTRSTGNCAPSAEHFSATKFGKMICLQHRQNLVADGILSVCKLNNPDTHVGIIFARQGCNSLIG